MHARLVHLKVKVKTLAAEARIIRKEESLAKDSELKKSLSDHRRGIVRSTARENLLAYAFLLGREYRQLEPKCTTPPDFREIGKLVDRFGPVDESEKRELRDRFSKWVEAAKAG